MNRKMYWGVAILILLLGTATLFIFINEFAKDSELDVQLKEAEKVANRIKQQQKKQVSEDEPGYKVQVVQGNEKVKDVSNETVSTEEEVFPRTRAEFEALPLEQQKALKHAARSAFWKERGLDPPPPGYTYRQNQDGYHLVKEGEALFRITWDNFGYHNYHQLSETEWEEYKALEVIAVYGLPGPRKPEATPAVVALAKEWYDKLNEKTWGPRPGVSVSASGGVWNTLSKEDGYERINRLAMEKLASLPPPSRSSVIDYAIVDRLLIELKTELEEK